MKIILTPSEAKILAGISSLSIPVPQLSAETKAAPTNLRLILKRLGEKGLIVREQDLSAGKDIAAVKLTEAGVRVRSLVAPATKKGYLGRMFRYPVSIFGKHSNTDQVLILPSDEDEQAITPSNDDLDLAIEMASRPAGGR